ncbi:Stk1 family PASTA domain-containing Ser/Thr kinase [Actinoalloteichus fjordicus]|uniref:non-specific serine/threonine protein kinase n=1 Tax=Actinoalloteichus fjordicus TaxID=1612552 RepID=A0AAC9PPR2_9PSEU|nr:Stk1 family PASTA domain-containing Ser/Thr kinase [Actinoalloteichus fjordicus]APU12127.1 serine/threonine protein kinase [Actinoalloteichus fjordicus]
MSTQRLLSNRYELGDTLGYGGMSEVHMGRDVRLSRDVAVKVLRADLARDPTFQLRFRREAQNAAALNHPAIVAVYDTGETETEHGPLPYIVMEYVDGRTLRDMVKGDGPLTGRRAMEIMADASAALDFSHRHGIIHRDVKPANIMITKSGAVKVMDFGIARALHDGQAAVTQTAAVIGTAQYLSPEQARGEAVDARSDVYAAGCVLFELLTGEPPFTGDSPVAVAYQHVREDPRRPSEVNDQITPALDAIILKAMSKNPANRYQSAAEMRADLIRVLSGQRPNAPMVMTDEERTTMLGGAEDSPQPGRRRRPPPPVEEDYDLADEEEERRARRRKGLVAALITVLCVGIIALAAYLTSSGFFNSGEDEAPPTQQVEVPADLVGMTEADARSALADAGLRINIGEGQESTAEDAGTVLATDPTPGSSVDEGSSVTITLGLGPGTSTVPDLSRMSAEDAGRALREVGLQLNPSYGREEVDDESLVDLVVGQDPPADQEVEADTSVQITLGVAAQQVSVINVVGQQYDVAAGNLQGAELDVRREDVDGVAEEGEVLSQNVPAGSTVDPGTTITLQVSRGNQITMPDLSLLEPEEAELRLRDLGWEGTFTEQTTGVDDIEQIGRVVDQSVNTGEPLGRSASVTVGVGRLTGGGPSFDPP